MHVIHELSNSTAYSSSAMCPFWHMETQTDINLEYYTELLKPRFLIIDNVSLSVEKLMM